LINEITLTCVIAVPESWGVRDALALGMKSFFDHLPHLDPNDGEWRVVRLKDDE
jgi:hypothetical protein